MRFIPTKVHGMIDYVAGLLLIVSPWLFGFANYVHWPHVIFGMSALSAGLMTRKIAYDSNSPVQMTQP